MISQAQYRLLKTIEANPGGRITDWATVLGVTTTTVWVTCLRLARDGVLIRVPLGKRSSRFVLSGSLGCCPSCQRPIVPAMKPDRHKRSRLTDERVRIILTSKATPQSLARRFGCSASYVAKLRLAARRAVAT